MVRFADGPLAGLTLQLARAPLFLRAVTGGEGGPDALDALDDAPAPGEAVTVYRRVGAAGTVHIDYRDRGGRRRGVTLACAEYAALPAGRQPGDAVTRDAAAWRAWAIRAAAGTTP